MIQNNLCFKLFANCIPVKGASRSIICDLQRSRYRFIPNLLHDILTSNKRKAIGEIRRKYNNQYDQGIDAFIDLLLKEEWGFLTSEPERFPDLNLEWDSPLRITNAIVDIGNNSSHDFNKIISQLSELGCESLQIRAYRAIPEKELHEILAPAHDTRLRSIELVIKYAENLTKDFIKDLVSTHKRIRNIIVHSSPTDERLTEFESDSVFVIFSTEVIDSNQHCGFISSSYFVMNIPLFTESQKHNNCLNRKIGIDENGEIKNCPSLQASFGNISETKLVDVIEQASFKEAWYISKDQLSVCKDCEFRYICTDCRAYIKDPNNFYSKPAKCTYNPYTASWEEEKDNPSIKFKF